MSCSAASRSFWKLAAASATADVHATVKAGWTVSGTGATVPDLFAPILSEGWRIRFAHRTFAWTSEATGKAAAYCVIVGFDQKPKAKARLWEYKTLKRPQVASFELSALANGQTESAELRPVIVQPSFLV